MLSNAFLADLAILRLKVGFLRGIFKMASSLLCPTMRRREESGMSRGQLVTGSNGMRCNTAMMDSHDEYDRSLK